MTKPALLSRFFKIGTSGPTVDGREISADDLEIIAETYDPDEFTASINLEHIRGISPWSSFSGLGTVWALKTEKDKKGRTAIFAQVAPTPYLMQLKKAGEKLFSSMEIQPKFAGTDKPYLVGLAMTDRPASLGTEAMLFSAQNGGPQEDRFKNHLFSKHVQTKDFAMTDQTDTADTPAAPHDNEPSFFEKFTSKFAKKEEGDTKNFSDLQKAALDLAEKFSDLDDKFADLTSKFNAREKTHGELQSTVTAQAETITKLTAALEASPDAPSRPAATPAEGEIQTDC